VLYRRAKTGERLASDAQAVIVLANRPLIDFGCDQVAVCDVVAGATGELIRFVNKFIVVFKESHNILYSTMHIVEVVTAGYSASYIFKHGIDEFQKASSMCVQHNTLLTSAKRRERFSYCRL
jgi:hypothetical protein